jgi:hypothetical protein
MTIPHYKKLLDLTTVRFPIGTEAFHLRYRYCKVMEAHGATRVVRAPALNNTNVFKLESYSVHVNELKVLENNVR